MLSVKTLTLQLIDDQPDRIRICRVESESLVTIVIPREDLSRAKSLPNIPQRGIYYLLNENHGYIRRVYAGQTTQGVARLEAHKSKKDFWNKAIMFLDEDLNINRDALDMLEEMAIDYVRSHGTYETDNSATPNPFVDPYKERFVRTLHENILFRMSALGYDLNRSDKNPTDMHDVFYTKRNGIHAKGRYNKETKQFTVLAGSMIDLSRPITNNMRVTCMRKDVFGELSGLVELNKDIEFQSPSAAAVFVLGSSQNVWTEWVNSDNKNLSEVYRIEDN